MQRAYQFSPVDSYLIDDEPILSWYATDAIVMMALAWTIRDYIQGCMLPSYYAMRPINGGVKAAVHEIHEALQSDDPPIRFFFRSDIKEYYASIPHKALHDLFCDHFKQPELQNLFWQYLNYVSVRDGNYRENKKGIPRGCPLSPLMGALYLLPLDQAMADHKVIYVRYMDDWVILATKRHTLKRAIKRMHNELAKLKLELHPDKTEMGRVEKGFDFLGYHYSSDNLDVAGVSLQRCTAKMLRLYEQGTTQTCLFAYWRRFCSYYCSVRAKVDRDGLLDRVIRYLKRMAQAGAETILDWLVCFPPHHDSYGPIVASTPCVLDCLA